MNTQKIHEIMTTTLAGNMIFPQVVGALAELGVESYRVDFIAGTDVFYLHDARTHTETLPERSAVAEDFSADALKAAIRGAQADTVRYPEFVQCCHAAGVAAYHVFITGRRAVYFGRKGEMHIEEFPASK
jgi:uncharacterized protein YbcV (DUF1398 family)